MGNETACHPYNYKAGLESHTRGISINAMQKQMFSHGRDRLMTHAAGTRKALTMDDFRTSRSTSKAAGAKAATAAPKYTQSPRSGLHRDSPARTSYLKVSARWQQLTGQMDLVPRLSHAAYQAKLPSVLDVWAVWTAFQRCACSFSMTDITGYSDLHYNIRTAFQSCIRMHDV